jgi:hypothetical protein
MLEEAREMGEDDPGDFLYMVPMKQRLLLSSSFVSRVDTLWRPI